jgi:four helix bundle protein
MTDLFPKHGGFRNLRSFQVAQQVYDATVVFCNKFIDKRSRTHDQMVQAARSGVQNIAEGSLASATSKKTEIKLTGVARASLGELFLTMRIFCDSESCASGKKRILKQSRQGLTSRTCPTGQTKLWRSLRTW